ncbi:MAG TPA: hypothetical protein VJQ45_04395 [Ktedonobacterales bacterium]|nr:hypothetical protein [Ktedonobacterales bacterium]
MKPENHRLRAEALETQIPLLTDPSAIIEICWGAAYQWICWGCDRKYGKHPQKHTGVVKYLKDIGELERSARWAAMEGVRIGGFYGTKAQDVEVALARQLLQEFRTWALSS